MIKAEREQDGENDRRLEDKYGWDTWQGKATIILGIVWAAGLAAWAGEAIFNHGYLAKELAVAAFAVADLVPVILIGSEIAKYLRKKKRK